MIPAMTSLPECAGESIGRSIGGRSSRRAWPAVAAALVLLGGGLPAAAQPGEPPSDMIGAVRNYLTVRSDTLLDLAIDNELGFVELVAANPGVDPWLPGAGVKLTLPTGHLLPLAPRRGIVINLADMRLYWFPPNGRPPESFPIGIGSEGWGSPTGQTSVAAKRKNPTWIPPASIRAENPELPRSVPPGPDNPLGDYAVNLGWRSYVIHGTNLPYGVGRRVSHGCFRMLPDDVEYLFGRIAVGTPVTVVDQPVKTGWHDGNLYLEVHPSQAQADELEERGRFTPEPVAGLRDLVMAAAGPAWDVVDWQTVERAARERLGVPVRITRWAGGNAR
jgi:L,D-transpeptidase ErfK/SrfK